MMKNYKEMIQEQLETELFKLYEKNNIEYYLDDMTPRFKTIKSLEELYDECRLKGDTPEIIEIMKNMKEEPDLKRFYPDKERILIHPYEMIEQDDPMYKDFISRTEFINRTGIFVSPMYFSDVYDTFCEAGVSADEFVRDYEEKYSDLIQESYINIPFKYEFLDNDVSGMGVYNDSIEPNIWEIVNSLSLSYYHKLVYADETIGKLCKIIEEYQNIFLTIQPTSEYAS